MNNENNNLGNPIPTNNQPTNNSQFMNQSFSQPQPVQPQYNNQVNYQQPVYNQQMSNAQVNLPPQMPNNFNQYPNQKKSNKNLFIIIGICVAVALAITILLIVLLGNDKNENKNEYENNNNINSGVLNEQPNTPSLTEIQSYKGFNFKKISGYQYKIANNMLCISNDQYLFILEITAANFNSFKPNYQTNISSSLKNIISGQTKLQSYSNVEVATYEVVFNGDNAIYFVLSSPNQSYCFEGFAIARDKTFNYSAINELVKLTSNSEYTGNFTNYSNDLGRNIYVNDLIEN